MTSLAIQPFGSLEKALTKRVVTKVADHSTSKVSCMMSVLKLTKKPSQLEIIADSQHMQTLL